jgi:hypothetical protein
VTESYSNSRLPRSRRIYIIIVGIFSINFMLFNFLKIYSKLSIAAQE